MAKHKGAVVFVEGVHYAVGKDGHANKDKPLRWDVESGGYRDAEPGEPLHNVAYGAEQGLVEVDPAIVRGGADVGI